MAAPAARERYEVYDDGDGRSYLDDELGAWSVDSTDDEDGGHAAMAPWSAADALRASAAARRHQTAPAAASSAAAAAGLRDDPMMVDVEGREEVDEEVDPEEEEAKQASQHYDLYHNGKLAKRKKKKGGGEVRGWKKSKKSADADTSGSGDAEFEASYKQYVRRYKAEDRPYLRGEQSIQVIAAHLEAAVGRLGTDAKQQIQSVPFVEAMAAAAAASTSPSGGSAAAGSTTAGDFSASLMQLAQFACEHAIANSKTPPQAHQVRAMKMLLRETSQVLDWPTGSGKCWGKDTRLLMYDGRSKCVQDIVAGDKLMGDDGTPRTVQAGSVIKGNTARDANTLTVLMPIKPGHGPRGPARGKQADGKYRCKYMGCQYTCSSKTGRASHENAKTLHVLVPSAKAGMYKIISNNAGRQSWTCNGEHILVVKFNVKPSPVRLKPGRAKPFSFTEYRVVDNIVQHVVQSFVDENDAGDARAAAYAAWEPLVWEGPVRVFLRFPPSVQARAQMFQPDAVQFHQMSKPLQRVLSDVLREKLADEGGMDSMRRVQVSQELTESVAWAIGLWLADGIEGQSAVSQIKNCKQLASDGHNQSHTAVVDRLKLVYEQLEGRSAGLDNEPSEEKYMGICEQDTHVNCLSEGGMATQDAQMQVDDEVAIEVKDVDQAENKRPVLERGIVRFNKMSFAGNAVYRILMGSVFRKILQHYNIYHSKRVPHHLLAEPREVRMALLAGIVDGDGHRNSNNMIELVSKGRPFLNRVIHLARGLGYSTGKVCQTKSTNEDGKEFTGWRIFLGGRDLYQLRMVLDYKRCYKTEPNKDQRCDGFVIKRIAHADYYGFALDGNGRCLLSDFTVTHNTLAACLSAVASLFLLDLQGKGAEKRVYFVTPKSLVDNMQTCMKEVFAGVDDAWIEQRCVFLTHKAFYLRYHHRDNLKELTGCVLLIDECHEFRNPLGKSAFVLLRTAPRWSNVLLLSATTTYNRPSDWVVPMALVYGSSAPLPGALVDRAADHIVSILHDRLEESAAPEMREQRAAATQILRILQNLVQRKWDVFELDAALLARMPSVSDEVVSIPMTAEFYLEQYQKMEQTASQGDLDAFAGGRRFDGRNTTVFYNGLRRLVNLYDEAHSDLQTPKIEWTIRELKRRRALCLAAHEPLEQSMIISSFVDMGSKQLEPSLTKAGFTVGVIHGALTQAERTALVDKFNNREIQVLLLSNVGSIGWDFKRVEFLVELDPGWNEAITQQRKGRGRRIDSHKDMPAHRRHVACKRLLLDLPPASALPSKTLTSNLSVDRYLYQLCEKKQRFLDTFRKLVFRTSIALFM
jgi:hypothetical protein